MRPNPTKASNGWSRFAGAGLARVLTIVKSGGSSSHGRCCHFGAPRYVFYKKSRMQYYEGCLNDRTAHG